MSKYDKLWDYICKRNEDEFKLTFSEIEKVAGVAIDHSFLTYKKELNAFRFSVGKISMKEQTIGFKRMVSSNEKS